ncbi:hypothetical protein [Streptomyces fumanus]|uniref:hypothetical protein n=1 Tax=Streptomyces fumanus TaxID=67302 RepID=UPI00340DB578
MTLLRQTAASHTDRAATLLLLEAVAMNAHLWHQVIPVAALLADEATRARDRRSEGRARYNWSAHWRSSGGAATRRAVSARRWSSPAASTTRSTRPH